MQEHRYLWQGVFGALIECDMRPSMLLNKMRALTPPGELDHPTSLFWYAFLSRLPRDIRVSCVPFVGVCSVPRERVEYDDEVITAVQDAIHAVKTRAGSLPQLLQLCYYHATFGHGALKCRRPCRWSTAQGNPRGRNWRAAFPALTQIPDQYL